VDSKHGFPESKLVEKHRSVFEKLPQQKLEKMRCDMGAQNR